MRHFLINDKVRIIDEPDNPYIYTVLEIGVKTDIVTITTKKDSGIEEIRDEHPDNLKLVNRFKIC